MNEFKTYIENCINLSQNEWGQMEGITEKRSLKKGEVFIPKNTRYSKEVFVCDGIVRAFLIDNDGNEKTTAFFSKYEFLSTNSHRTDSNGLSLYNYQAIKASTVVLLDSRKFSKLYGKLEKLKQLVSEVKEREVLRLNERDECILQVRADDKYLKFRKFYPNLESEIAHHYIASYLGITAVSLSRIRSKLGITSDH